MKEPKIKRIIAESFRKGKGGFPKCDYITYAKTGKISDEISNKYGRFDIVGFSQDHDTFYLVETKDIGKDNKRLVSLGQVFGQSAAYEVAIGTDLRGFRDSCIDKFGSQYAKYVASFPNNKLKLKMFIGIDKKDAVREEFITRLTKLFRNRVGAIIVSSKKAGILLNPKTITLTEKQKPIQLLKIFDGSRPKVKRLVLDLAKDILRLGPTIYERERTDRWCACAKKNFVEFFKRKNGAFIQYHKSARKRFDGQITYTNIHQKPEILKKIRKSIEYCQ